MDDSCVRLLWISILKYAQSSFLYVGCYRRARSLSPSDGCSSVYLFVHFASLSTISSVKNWPNIANGSPRLRVGGRFGVLWLSKLSICKGSKSGSSHGSRGGFLATRFGWTLYWVGWTRSISLEVRWEGIVDGNVLIKSV